MFSLSCQNTHQSNQRSLECVTCALVRRDQQSWSRGEGGHARGSLNPSEDTGVHGGCLRSWEVPQPLSTFFCGEKNPSNPRGFSPGVTNLLNPLRLEILLPHLSEKGRSLGFLLFHMGRASQQGMGGCPGRDRGSCVTAHSYSLQGDCLSWEPSQMTEFPDLVWSCLAPEKNFSGLELSCPAVSDL